MEVRIVNKSKTQFNKHNLFIYISAKQLVLNQGDSLCSITPLWFPFFILYWYNSLLVHSVLVQSTSASNLTNDMQELDA